MPGSKNPDTAGAAKVPKRHFHLTVMGQAFRRPIAKID